MSKTFSLDSEFSFGCSQHKWSLTRSLLSVHWKSSSTVLSFRPIQALSWPSPVKKRMNVYNIRLNCVTCVAQFNFTHFLYWHTQCSLTVTALFIFVMFHVFSIVFLTRVELNFCLKLNFVSCFVSLCLFTTHIHAVHVQYIHCTVV